MKVRETTRSPPRQQGPFNSPLNNNPKREQLTPSNSSGNLTLTLRVAISEFLNGLLAHVVSFHGTTIQLDPKAGALGHCHQSVFDLRRVGQDARLAQKR